MPDRAGAVTECREDERPVRHGFRSRNLHSGIDGGVCQRSRPPLAGGARVVGALHDVRVVRTLGGKLVQGDRCRSGVLDRLAVGTALDRFTAARHHRWRKTEASKLQRSHHRVEHQPATIRLVGEFLLTRIFIWMRRMAVSMTIRAVTAKNARETND